MSPPPRTLRTDQTAEPPPARPLPPPRATFSLDIQIPPLPVGYVPSTLSNRTASTPAWSAASLLYDPSPHRYDPRLPGEVAEWSKALPWLKGVRVKSPSRVRTEAAAGGRQASSPSDDEAPPAPSHPSLSTPFDQPRRRFTARAPAGIILAFPERWLSGRKRSLGSRE